MCYNDLVLICVAIQYELIRVIVAVSVFVRLRSLWPRPERCQHFRIRSLYGGQLQVDESLYVLHWYRSAGPTSTRVGKWNSVATENGVCNICADDTLGLPHRHTQFKKSRVCHKDVYSCSSCDSSVKQSGKMMCMWKFLLLFLWQYAKLEAVPSRTFRRKIPCWKLWSRQYVI